jgi:hypothetical protein
MLPTKASTDYQYRAVFYDKPFDSAVHHVALASEQQATIPPNVLKERQSRDGLIEESRESRESCESRATIEIPDAAVGASWMGSPARRRT